MSEDSFLKKISKIILGNNKKLVIAIDDKIRESEKRADKKLDRVEQVLSKKIDNSQNDTIEALSDIINTGYDHHEDRIDRIEKELNLPPLKLKTN